MSEGRARLVPDARIALRDGRRAVVGSAREEDADGVVALMRSVASERGYTLFEPEEFDEHAAGIARRVREAAEGKEGLRLVARSERGEVVGDLSLSVYEYRRLAHVAKFGMEIGREWRGVGLGDAMMRAMMAWCREHPTVKRVELQVFADNGPAIALYRKHGFEVEGRRRAYMCVGGRMMDDLLMATLIEKGER